MSSYCFYCARLRVTAVPGMTGSDLVCDGDCERKRQLAIMARGLFGKREEKE